MPKLDTLSAKTLKAIRKHAPDRKAAATELGIPYATLRSRILAIQSRHPDEDIPVGKTGGAPRISARLVAEAVAAVEKAGGVRQAARAMGINAHTLIHRVEQAKFRSDWKPLGRSSTTKMTRRPLPKGKAVSRYILTCAQSDTKLHEPTWKALHAWRDHYGAELLVSTFSYNQRREGSAKRGTEKHTDPEWYDPRIEEFVVDEMVALAPSLVWNGHMNILPTAVDPLSGMTNYNGRASSVFPHVKVAMGSIATTSDSAAKFQYTTGAATQRNYIQRKAGQKAEFDHVYGGLLVEVTADGSWWARQLITDSKGRIYDLDWVAMPTGEVVPSIGARALVFGDLHETHLTEETRKQRWGKGGFVETLRPEWQVAHDVLDMESRGHHNRRDPHKMFELHIRKRECVRSEVEGVGGLLNVMRAHGGVVVVDSNHDRHLDRWLKEADWRSDPVNAEFYTECQRAYLSSIRAGKRFNALKWAVGQYNAAKGVRFLEPGESFVVCRDSSGGVELGLHGDLGPGGARGSIRNLSRIGRKVIIGHSHAAGIFNGAWQVGVTAPIDAFSYASGAPSAWSHTDCIVQANGKRQMVTWWKGKWRA